MRRASSISFVGVVLLLAAAARPSWGGAFGGPYVPAGTLYDNGQAADLFPVISQESTDASRARAADDFIIPVLSCESGIFEIDQVRIQIVQSVFAQQPFAVDLYRDDGTGAAPTSGISPFVTLAQTSAADLGMFTIDRNLWEAGFVPASPLRLTAGVKYWISGFGATAAANSGDENNFFAGSDGAAGTTKNGVVIAPDGDFPSWTPVVIQGEASAFSFAIDGACLAGANATSFDVAVPALSQAGIAALASLLAIASLALLRRPS